MSLTKQLFNNKESIYKLEESLCDYIHNTYVDALASIKYWEKHKRRKCYKCGKYGHQAKECESICPECENYHQGKVCIFALSHYYKRLYHAAQKLLEVNKEDKLREIIEESGIKAVKSAVKSDIKKFVTKLENRAFNMNKITKEVNVFIHPTYKVINEENIEIIGNKTLAIQQKLQQISEDLKYQAEGKIRDGLWKEIFTLKNQLRAPKIPGILEINNSEIVLGNRLNQPSGQLANKNHKKKRVLKSKKQNKVHVEPYQVRIQSVQGEFEHTRERQYLQQLERKVKELNEAINQTKRQQRLAAYNRERNLNREVKILQQQKERAQNRVNYLHKNEDYFRLKMQDIFNKRYKNKLQKLENQYIKLKNARTLATLKYNQFNQKKNIIYNKLSDMRRVQKYAVAAMKRNRKGYNS